MLKKILAVCLVIIILNPFYYQIKRVDAAAAPAFARVVKGTVGEKIVVSMMEKQGMKFANQTAREKAVERWNLELYKKIQEANKIGDELRAAEYARFQNQVANATMADVVEMPNKKGFGQYILKGAMFATGADIVYEIYQAYEEAKAYENMMETMQDAQRKLEDGEYYTTYQGFTISHTDHNYYIHYNGKQVYESHPYNSGWYVYSFLTGKINDNFYSFSVYFVVASTWEGADGIHVPNPNFVNVSKADLGMTNNTKLPATDFNIVKSPVREIEFPDYAPVELPDVVPPEIPINIPTEGTVGEPYPWNDPVGEPNPNPNPNPIPIPWPQPAPGVDPLPEVPEPPLPPDPPPVEDGGIDFGPLITAGGAVKDNFPFSIPWDFYRLVGNFNASPQAPVFKVDVKETVDLVGKKIPIHYKFDLNLSTFDAVAAIGRWAMIIIFDIAMILALRRLTPD